MFKYTQVKGTSCPIAVCTECGERIEDAAKATVLYLPEHGTMSLIHHHCFRATASEYNDYASEDMATFMIYLLHNLREPEWRERAEAQAITLERA